MSDDAPPVQRSYLDDIDGDDTAPNSSPVESTNKSESALNSSQSEFIPPNPTSALDDIDGDDTPAIAQTDSKPKESTASTVSTIATSSSSSHSPSDPPTPSLPPAAVETTRILRVLSADSETASTFASVSNNAANPASASSASTSSSAIPTKAYPNYFAILGLREPELNMNGEPIWTVEDEELRRAFRKLVVLIHPDKNPAEGAKTAFESLKLAHSVLSNEKEKYDYIKNYCAFRKFLETKSKDYVPRSVTNLSLESTLAQGKKLAELKAKQTSKFAEKLLSQSAAKMEAVRRGEVERKNAEEKRRQEELKRKVMESSSSSSEEEKGSGSDDDSGLSVAEKIRLAKLKQKKKPRMF